jgi:hypothetical protein
VRRNGLPILLCLVAIFGLIYGVTAGALWDPHELSVAELSRRIALNLLGGSNLSIPGADNSLPIRADLGRGELPFTSAALGFRLFGLSEWAGRVPLVLWALAGLGALFASLSALWDRRAGLYGVAILATTPLYFLQARTLLGDGVTLATFTLAWSCLSAAVLAPSLGLRGRAAFALAGALGLYGGFWCRGLVLSVAAPALAVGLAARFAPPASRVARGLGWALLALGLAALGVGLAALSLVEKTHDYSVLVGSSLRLPDSAAPTPSFDAALGRFVHAAFPWSALGPLALALPLRRAPSGESEPQRAAALSALLAFSLALGAIAWVEPSLGELSLPAAGAFAALLALSLRELETRPRALPLLALCSAALAVIIGLDLRAYPEKVLAGFGVAGGALPESLHDRSAALWLVSALALAGALGLWLFDHDEDAAPVFRAAEYRRVLGTLQQAYEGNLVFSLLVLEAGLVGFLLLSAISERLVHLEQLDGFGVLTRKLVAGLAVLTPLLAFVPLQAMAARDASRWLFRRPWLSRPQALLGVATLIGIAGSVSFYPAVSRQLAPKQVFDRYRELGRPGEPLGMLGEASVSARYQAGASAETLGSLSSAFEWLEAGGSGGPRRWLLVRASDLPDLNARFRERHQRNLPVLDARSSELVLASNRTLPGERDQSPLAGLVLSEPPVAQHPLRAVLGKKLEVLGYSILGADGNPRPRITPATPYRFVIYYRVLAPLSGKWKTFVHIDGLQRRFNADHVPLEGRYPLAYWGEGDIIVDSTELLLEPNFSPGRYQLYFGLYQGERRLEVSEGPSADDRVVAGRLEIE